MPSPSRALVGREAEVAQIDEVLERVETGSGVVLAIEGEPGIGKTRLLEELRTRAEQRGHLVLRGSASEFEAYLPFELAVDAFDAYLASRDDGPPANLRRELGAILPTLREEGGAAPTSGDERYRAHRAVRGLIEWLASERPLAVIFDDVHWADDGSLELIQSLLRRPAEGPGLLALGFRSGQAPERLRLAVAGPEVEVMSLGPLSREAAAELLAGEASARELEEIYEQAGGNPFYLEQLLRTRDRGVVPETPEGGVPAGVAAAVDQELTALASDPRALLRAAAIAGEPFEPDVAAEIAELAQGAGLAALDELLAVDMVRPTEMPRRFAFRHPLVRRAVYESTPAGTRIAAHGRAAAALAARGAPTTARAHHVEHAARRGDAGAIELLLEAGRASAGRAPVLAARWFEAALRLLPASDAEAGIAVRRRLAEALRTSGQLEACRSALVEAIELAAEDNSVRIELTARCAAVERWLGRDREARLRLTREWERLPEKQTAGGAALQVELSVDGVFDRDLPRAIAAGEAALATARALELPSLIGAAASALCLAEAGAGRTEVALRHRAEACELVDGLTEAELIEHPDSLYYLGWAENYLEDFDAALGHVDRMIDAVRRGDGAQPLVPLLLVKCYPLETTGRLAEAAALAEAAVEAAQLDAAAHFLPWALFERAWAHHYAGELGEAIACAEESMRISESAIGGSGPSAGIGPVWVIASAKIESGRPEEAAELLRPMVGEDIEGAMPVERALFWETLVLAEAGAGGTERAEEYVRRSEADAEMTGLAIPRGAALRARAALTLATGGDPSRAAELAAESAAVFASVDARIEVAFSRNLQGAALAEAGARELAIPVLREAEAELDVCGSLRQRDAARRELRKLGARAEVRGPATGADSGVESLTNREREIADLVTDRYTNREIAAELFLSEKTIESHLRNVFAKLGASSRVEVARLIERSHEGRGVRRDPGRPGPA